MEGNAHEVEAFRIGNRLQKIAFTVNGRKKSRVEFEWDEDGSAVLRIGPKVYVLIPEPEPETAVFKTEDASYNAYILKEGATVTASDSEKAFMLDGDGSFCLHGDQVKAVDDRILYEGHWYAPGSQIVINGRSAVLHKSSA